MRKLIESISKLNKEISKNGYYFYWTIIDYPILSQDKDDVRLQLILEKENQQFSNRVYHLMETTNETRTSLGMSSFSKPFTENSLSGSPIH